MKKISYIMLAAIMLIVLASGCGSNNNNGAAATNAPKETSGSGETEATEAPKKDVTIKVFQFKVEIADALAKMAADYEKEKGVKVEIETHGGGEDYSALLKAELAAGEEPEIFNSSGWAGFDPYVDRATDLTGEAWAKD